MRFAPPLLPSAANGFRHRLLADRLELPPGVSKRPLGDLRLRGKGTDVALYALTKAPEEAGRADVFVGQEVN